MKILMRHEKPVGKTSTFVLIRILISFLFHAQLIILLFCKIFKHLLKIYFHYNYKLISKSDQNKVWGLMRGFTSFFQNQKILFQSLVIGT